MHEEEVRKRVKALKNFYRDLINFFIVNAALTIIWLTFDRTGTFWPKYVMLVWGIALFIRASRTGVTQHFFHRSHFLSPEWEEKKVREYMRIHKIKNDHPPQKEDNKK